MKKFRIAAVAFCVLTAVSVYGQKATTAIDKVAQPVIEQFFKSVGQNRAGEAVTVMFSTNPNFDVQDSSILNVVQQMEYVESISGAFMGKTLARKREVEDAFTIYVYIAKYEKKFYRFLFTFYNNTKVVRLYKFSLDEQMLEEAEGSLKFYE